MCDSAHGEGLAKVLYLPFSLTCPEEKVYPSPQNHDVNACPVLGGLGPRVCTKYFFMAFFSITCPVYDVIVDQ